MESTYIVTLLDSVFMVCSPYLPKTKMILTTRAGGAETNGWQCNYSIRKSLQTWWDFCSFDHHWSSEHLLRYFTGIFKVSELTPTKHRDLDHVMFDGDRVFGHLQAEVKSLHCKPVETGQQAVVHESSHDLAGGVVLRTRYILIWQEGHVEQEQRHKEINQHAERISGLHSPKI